MGRSSLPFSVCMVWNLCILSRIQQILCTVLMRGVSPEDSSELQSKIGVLNDPLHESLFALEKPRASKLGMGTLIFHSHGGSMSRAVLWHGSWKSLVSDAIRDFLTHLGLKVLKCLENTGPFQYLLFCRPLRIGSSLIQRQEKFTLLPWKRCELSAIKGNQLLPWLIQIIASGNCDPLPLFPEEGKEMMLNTLLAWHFKLFPGLPLDPGPKSEEKQSRIARI